MLFRYEYSGGVWVDLEHPTEEEVRKVAQEFGIGERLETELFTPTPAPLVSNESAMTFLVMHFPTYGDVDGETREQEIDFVVGDHFIITVRYEVVEPLHRLQKLLEAEQLIAPHNVLATDVLLEILFAHLYTSVRDHTSHIASRLARIEHDMFNGLGRATVRLISDISREFLHVEAAIANQEEPLERFVKAIALRGGFGKTFAERAERILAERAQVGRLVGTYRAVATELRETNASLLEARQNEIMKTLTVITFGVMPLELIALVFGMHAIGTPLEQNPNEFWIILAIMFGVGGLMMYFFTRRQWLS
ncbi:MAG: CorA family divalent cation transporter [Candidatus Paceibacterota bacterium]|jgi:magnesium transporter